MYPEVSSSTVGMLQLDTGRVCDATYFAFDRVIWRLAPGQSRYDPLSTGQYRHQKPPSLAPTIATNKELGHDKRSIVGTCARRAGPVAPVAGARAGHPDQVLHQQRPAVGPVGRDFRVA